MPIGNGLTTKYFSWDATSPHFALDYEYLQQNPTIDTIYLSLYISQKSNDHFWFSSYTQRVFIILYLK